jgi:NAD(P)H-dependent FMN reductase
MNGENDGPLRLLILYGSVRSDRQGIRAARFLERRCRDRRHEATLIDPVEHPLPLLDRMYKEYPKGQAPEVLERLASHIREADGFLIVSGEYNHSIPPALSNLMDHFLEEWFWRPSAIACYSAGAFGGVRAAMQLRVMLCELGTPSIPSLFPVPRVQDAFDESGAALDPAYDRRVARFLDEFEWYARALKRARAGGVPY